MCSTSNDILFCAFDYKINIFVNNHKWHLWYTIHVLKNKNHWNIVILKLNNDFRVKKLFNEWFS